jgi:hypothetical protein
MNSDFSIRLLCGLSYYACCFIRNVTITQFVNLVSLLRQKFKILNSYLGSAENPTQHRNDKHLWEILLQTTSFRNEDNWKDDGLHIEAFYQALNGRHYSNITDTALHSVSFHQNNSEFKLYYNLFIHKSLC